MGGVGVGSGSGARKGNNSSNQNGKSDKRMTQNFMKIPRGTVAGLISKEQSPFLNK